MSNRLFVAGYQSRLERIILLKKVVNISPKVQQVLKSNKTIFLDCYVKRFYEI